VGQASVVFVVGRVRTASRPRLSDKVEEGRLVVGRDDLVVADVEASFVDLVQRQKTMHGEEIHQFQVGVHQLTSLWCAQRRVY
jgi:hypothetical protein